MRFLLSRFALHSGIFFARQYCHSEDVKITSIGFKINITAILIEKRYLLNVFYTADQRSGPEFFFISLKITLAKDFFAM